MVKLLIRPNIHDKEGNYHTLMEMDRVSIGDPLSSFAFSYMAK